MTTGPATLNERARQGAGNAPHLAHSTRGRLSWDYDTARFSSGGARRRPTDSEAVNGSRAVRAEARCMMGRNSPQPSHYLTGNTADALKSTVPLPVMVKLDGASGELCPEASSLFFREANHTHELSPVRSIASVNMEKSVSEVCKIKSCSVSDADIEQARQVHQRLVVRMMTAPGDSKGAMYRIEAAFGLSYHCQANLRHQNRASGEFIARLHAAWLSVLEASVKRDVAELLAEREKTEAA